VGRPTYNVSSEVHNGVNIISGLLVKFSLLLCARDWNNNVDFFRSPVNHTTVTLKYLNINPTPNNLTLRYTTPKLLL